jgi:hypothetical protein
MMVVDEHLDRLNKQLSGQSLGPVDAVVNEMMVRLIVATSSLVTSLRQAAYDQPLITLLLSWQVGYLAARLGRRHARR